MRKMFLHIKHNEAGPTFKIPVSADEFVKDAMPVIVENNLPEPEPIDHDDWYNMQHAFDNANPFETYK